MLITSTQAKAIRRKQADKNLTAKKASEEIGVNPITYKIRDGGEVKPSIYQKAMQWLAEDYQKGATRSQYYNTFTDFSCGALPLGIDNKKGGKKMIDFAKEAGMALLWVFLGYLVGERNSKK